MPLIEYVHMFTYVAWEKIPRLCPETLDGSIYIYSTKVHAIKHVCTVTAVIWKCKVMKQDITSWVFWGHVVSFSFPIDMDRP